MVTFTGEHTQKNGKLNTKKKEIKHKKWREKIGLNIDFLNLK